MKDHIIIRGRVNGGKTTTCGALYEKLKKTADFSKLYTNNWHPIANLQYSPEGNLYDFIAIIIIDGVLIIIISQGDVAHQLEEVLDQLKDLEFVKDIANGRTDIDFIVCCARSQMRKKSTIEMLYKRIPETHRKEFWASEKVADKSKAQESKQAVVSEIIGYIKQKKA